MEAEILEIQELGLSAKRSSRAARSNACAVHHGTARPVFFDIVRDAVTHRIRSRIITGIDLGVLLVARVNPQPPQRPVRCGRRGVRRDLRHLHPRRRGLRHGSRCRPKQGARQSEIYRRRLRPHHKPIRPLQDRRDSSIRRPLQLALLRMREPKHDVGPPPNAHRSPKWKRMAHDIFERLPKGFRALCEGVIIRVDDFPTEEVLDEMEAAERIRPARPVSGHRPAVPQQ